MKRREFISLVGGAAAAWPLAGHAQQPPRMRRIGVLMNLAEDDPESPVQVAAFLQGLQQLGWIVGRNVQIDIRWGAGDADRIRRYAAELVALAPDIILANGTSTVAPLQQVTRTMEIVFVNVADPVGAGFVASLMRPGGNATGFTLYEFGMSAKWLELLKQIAPSVTRVAVLRDPTQEGSGSSQLRAIQVVAPWGVEVRPIDARDAGEIDRAVAALARESNAGLIVLPGPTAAVHHQLIVTLAARYRLPAVYPYRYFVKSGGLISYGVDPADTFRRTASYVHRILSGNRPSDLPVQQTAKYELVINLKTAKALGLTVPRTLLATADEVIE